MNLAEKSIKRIAYATGFILLLLCGTALVVPSWERIYAKGKANTGHEALRCVDCHLDTPGTVRQQLQAKARYWLHLRHDDIPFGRAAVDNQRCDHCHAREQDAHPPYRFLEPRFRDARAAISPHLCVSCHREHQGVRVTMPAGACEHCHQDLDLKRDPLDVSHKQLIAAKDWLSCLGCHDFHNNHRREAQTSIERAYPPKTVKRYFEGGESPYGADKKYPTRHPEKSK